MVSARTYLQRLMLTHKAMNMVIAFYAATFPGLVQDLPEVIKSEQDVMDGSVRWVPSSESRRKLTFVKPRGTRQSCLIPTVKSELST
jgi:hypothetical protein